MHYSTYLHEVIHVFGFGDWENMHGYNRKSQILKEITERNDKGENLTHAWLVTPKVR